MLTFILTEKWNKAEQRKLEQLKQSARDAQRAYVVAAREAGLPSDVVPEWVDQLPSREEIRAVIFTAPDVEKRRAAMATYVGAEDAIRAHQSAEHKYYERWAELRESYWRSGGTLLSIPVVVVTVMLGHWVGGMLGNAVVGAVSGGAVAVLERLGNRRDNEEQIVKDIATYRDLAKTALDRAPFFLSPAFDRSELETGEPSAFRLGRGSM